MQRFVDESLRDAHNMDMCNLCYQLFSEEKLSQRLYTKYRAEITITIPDRNGNLVEKVMLQVQFRCLDCEIE